MSKQELMQADAFSDDGLPAERLVYKDNALIMASYSISVEEQRLLLACIEKAQRKKHPLDAAAIEISLSVNEYAELYGVKLNTAYKVLKLASNKLYERSIRIKDNEIDRSVRWLQEKALYNSGKVNLTFSSVISRHIKDIVTEKSVLRLEQATQLRSQHAIRFFEIFSMAINPSTQEGTWEVTVEKLKEIFEIENSYERWIDLKNKVINTSLQQINKNTSLKVDWEVAAKKGKTPIGLRFFVFESRQLNLSIN